MKSVIISPPNMPRQHRGVLNFVFTVSKVTSKLHFLELDARETGGFDTSHCDAAAVRSFGAKD